MAPAALLLLCLAAPSKIFEPSIALWKDTPIKERGPPPYVPPSTWKYNTGGGPVPGKINVHLVPHSHDDTGWQVTVDQYFFTEVYYILDTLLDRLTEDPNRRFMFVETAFFARWWQQQPQEKQQRTRDLVNQGRLEFVNGGWCMHDEAVPYYVEMVDQTTRGHQFLKQQFGEVAFPKGTWQIDPFGHSNTNAWLIGAESGMNYEFWGRMDYQDFAMRVNHSRLEWVWQGSQSLGSSAQIFAGQLFGGGNQGYGTFFSYDSSRDDQVQDDPRRHDYNIDQVVDQFVQHAQFQAKSFRTVHQMWACGADFNYQNADRWYHNLDKIIHYVNQNGSVNAFYSTPTFYVQQKLAPKLDWEVRQDDIFPLANTDHAYWSGYFTSRPTLKSQVRKASNFLNAARVMEIVSGVKKSDIVNPTTRPSPVVGTSWTDSLEGTIGVATHHDGMSGTERQDVSNDYELRISESHGEVEQGVALAFSKLTGFSPNIEHCNCNAVGADNCLNISMCHATSGTNQFTMFAWNPLGRPSSQVVRIPVVGAGWHVSGENGTVHSDATPLDDRTLSLPLLYLNKFGLTPQQISNAEAKLKNPATHVLVFDINLPPLGYAVFVANRSQARPETPVKKPAADVLTIENEYYSLSFNSTTGLAMRLVNKKRNSSTPFAVDVAWYNSSSVGGCTAGGGKKPCNGERSGAYLFRPNTSTLFYPGPTAVPQLRALQGGVVQEVYQTFSSWATLVYRLYAGSSSLDVEWTVGPIPVGAPWFPPVYKNESNNWGKEVIVRYRTGIQSSGTFYTDSNGREMVRRQRNARGPSYPPLEVNEPIAGNYYPVTAMISVDDGRDELAVLTDISQGGSSLADGSVELMVHRRLQADDNRGVQEPLNETMCGCNDIHARPGQMGEHGKEGDGGCLCEGLTVRGIHRLIFDRLQEAHVSRRQHLEELLFPATLAFSSSPPASTLPSKSFLQQALPPAIKLMTLTNNYASINDGKTLLRLAHLYSVNESTTYSVPVTVDLRAVFGKSGLVLDNIVETQLTATHSLQQMEANRLRWTTFDPTGGRVLQQLKEVTPFEKRSYLSADGQVTIRPMEVRTFLVTFQ